MKTKGTTEYERTRTIDYKFAELCDEIDALEGRVEYWESRYNDLMAESIKRTNENIDAAKKGVANALMFALSFKDDENGNLVISKEDRKVLAARLQ